MAVTVYINGVKVLKANKYDWDEKWDNNTEDTFDGPDISAGLYPKFTVKISRINSYNASFETILRNAIAANPDGMPIVIEDGNITDTFTGCMLDSRGGGRDPKKKQNEDLSFSAVTMDRKTS